MLLAASTARGGSPQKHVYVRYMSMFVLIDICPTRQYDCLNHATARLVRFSGIYTAHQQTTTCFKTDLFPTFFDFFFTEFQNEGGRKPRRRPPRRRRTGLILLYRIIKISIWYPWLTDSVHGHTVHGWSTDPGQPWTGYLVVWKVFG
jgi:hypothetical protein